LHHLDNTPRDDGVGPVHGRCNNTLFVVEAEIESLNTSTEPVMYVYRKDYFLYSKRSRPKTGYWNMSVAEFSAVCKCQKAIFHVSNQHFIMPAPCGEYFNVSRITNVSDVYMPLSYVPFKDLITSSDTLVILLLSGLLLSWVIYSLFRGGVSNNADAKKQKKNEGEEQTKKEVEDLQAVVKKQTTEAKPKRSDAICNIGMSKEVFGQGNHGTEKQTKNGAEEEQTKEVKDLQAVVVEAKKDAKDLQARSDLKTLSNIEVSKEVIGQGSHETFVFAGYFKPSNKEIEKREVAVKRLIRGHQSLADKEIRILLKLENHENVVRYYGSAENEDFVYLAIERCWVNLFQFIETEKGVVLNSICGIRLSVNHQLCS